jgi:Uma2 family endonuclease
MAVELKRYRFTVDEHHRMAEAGILDEDSRVELIEGEIVDVPPIGPDHMDAVIASTHVFVRMFGDVARVSTQNPIRTSHYGEPQPDLTLLKRREEGAGRAIPTPQDVFLVVEVSDTTLAADRGIKIPLYARSGVPETWLLDLPHGLVHVYREQSPMDTEWCRHFGAATAWRPWPSPTVS